MSTKTNDELLKRAYAALKAGAEAVSVPGSYDANGYASDFRVVRRPTSMYWLMARYPLRSNRSALSGCPRKRHFSRHHTIACEHHTITRRGSTRYPPRVFAQTGTAISTLHNS